MMVWRADSRAFPSAVESTLQCKVNRLNYLPMKAPTFIVGFLRRLVLRFLRRETIGGLARQGGSAPAASSGVEPYSAPNSATSAPVAFASADFFD